MAWMFNEANSGAKRLFISFIECRIIGPWVRVQQSVGGSEVMYVWRSRNEQTCIVDIVAPDGLRRSWRFKNDENISMTQNILEFLSDSVAEEIAVDDDLKMGKKDKPRPILD